MSSVIGSLRADLGLNSAKFESGARRVKSPLANMKKQFLAITAVAAAAGAAISGAALAGARDIDRAAKAARRLDASIGGFRALELAADEAGVNLSSLTSDIQTMNREIASIGTTGNGKRALDALGLSIDDLAGKDADERLAIIADQVKTLGLSSGQTTAILRDLGVRNREMVLLVAQGGDVIRQARQDMEDYGLAGQRVDSMAPAMERANDAMSRLGLIGRLLRQQLAFELVPAMGDFAQSMTDSLRTGGALRGMIDGLASNIKRIGTYLAVAVAGFGIRFVGALVAAKVATFTLSGAFLVLRGALIRTGIGALIVGAGELVYQFSKLVEKSGGVGNAFGLIGDIFSEVGDRIGQAITGLGQMFTGLGMVIKEAFKGAFEWVRGAINDYIVIPFAKAVNAVIAVANTLGASFDEVDVPGASGDAGTLLRSGGRPELTGADFISGGLNNIKASATAPLESIAALREVMKGTAEETDNASDAANRFNSSLEEIDDSGSGAAGGVKKVKKAVSDLSDGMKSVESSAKSAFAGLVTGAKSAKEALADVLKSFATMLANRVFDSLFSPFFANIPGFASGTNFAPGGMALVGERGPELVNLPRGSQVIPNHRIGGASGGGDTHITYAPVIDARGADAGAVARLEAALQKAGAEFESRVVKTVVNAKKRRVLT